MTHLARLENASTQDLDKISAVMENYIRDSNLGTQQVAAVLEQKGILARLFPSKVERARSALAVEDMRQHAAFKNELMGLYQRFQVEKAKQHADALLATLGIELQTQLAAFATVKIQELQQTLNAGEQRFANEMKAFYNDLENYRDCPPIYDKLAESFTYRVATFFEVNKTLLDGFVAALKTKIATSA